MAIDHLQGVIGCDDGLVMVVGEVMAGFKNENLRFGFGCLGRWLDLKMKIYVLDLAVWVDGWI